MNKFVILLFASLLLGYTNARPDLSLGYRCNQGHSSGGETFLQAPATIPTSYSPIASGNSYFASPPVVGQIGNSGFVPSTQLRKQISFSGFSQESSNFGSSKTDGNTQYSSGSFDQTHEGVQQSFQAPIVSKHFYIHTAPTDDGQQEVVRHIQIGQPQKNYRIVFIDTASTHSAKAKIIANIAPSEEKTAIYVLSKKSNDLDINTEVNTPASVNNNKPEVFYVKYNTPEEAAHAQHTIEAQYDALGGTTDVSNEGVIPVSSVIGTVDGLNANSDIATSVFTNDGSFRTISTPTEIRHTGINIQQNYLPANRSFKI